MAQRHEPDVDAPDYVDEDDDTFGVGAIDAPEYFGYENWANYHPRLNSIQRDLYAKLAGMVNTERRRARNDTEVWPSLELLAVWVCLSRGDKVLPHLKVLEQERMIEIENRRVNGIRVRNKYRVRFSPPPGYDGPTTMADIMAAGKVIVAEREEAAAEKKRAAAEKKVKQPA